MKAISSKTSLSSATMTTTISRHELQLQATMQQNQLLQQQQTILSPQTNILIENKASYYTAAYDNLITTTTTTATCLDSATTIIQIDSLNNNNNTSLIATTSTPMTSTTTLPTSTNLTATATTPTRTPAITPIQAHQSTTSLPSAPLQGQGGSHNNNNNGNNSSPDSEMPKLQKRRSLLNFKSFDFNIKSIYSGLRSNKNYQRSHSSSVGGGGGGGGGGNANGSGTTIADTPTTRQTSNIVGNRMTPFLKVESVDIDAEESANLLFDFPQSTQSSRRSSAQDDNRSTLQINRYDHMSRSQASSPSPYFLSPYPSYATDSSNNIRRSSTSDITGKRSGASSASESRRPSTSDLLRRARERRGSEARMGRSVSHTGLTRGGGLRSGPKIAGPGAGGGRRTSMAF